MRYFFPAVLVVAAVGLSSVLWSHPPGSSSLSGGSTPPQSMRARSGSVPGPAETAANQPTAAGPAITAAMPMPGAGEGDPVAGRQVFRKCQARHSLEPGKDLVGPSLAGIVGRKAGSDPNFSYSPAMKGAGITWTPQTLDSYLADPEKVFPRQSHAVSRPQIRA